MHDGCQHEPARTCTASAPSGRPLPGFEVRIADDGEIEVRSETVFQGYFKEPEATAAVLSPDGWLKTGDIGHLDEEGFLHITDRKKDILVTAGGKNVAPQNIENDLKTSKYVSQALVVGDKRPYVAALITLDPVEIGRWAAEQGVDGDVAALAADERVHELLQGASTMRTASARGSSRSSASPSFPATSRWRRARSPRRSRCAGEPSRSTSPTRSTRSTPSRRSAAIRSRTRAG